VGGFVQWYVLKGPTKHLGTDLEPSIEGISGIKPEEAAKLHEPTAHLPWDNETYVISLAVFHQLHCVNHLRKVLYPDEYPELWEYNEDGSVKRDALTSLHSGSSHPLHYFPVENESSGG
jgi:hypothetical protein